MIFYWNNNNNNSELKKILYFTETVNVCNILLISNIKPLVSHL